LSCVREGLWKMGKLWVCVEMSFDFKFNVFLKVLLCSWTYKQHLGTNLGVRRSKIGFLSEKGHKTVKKLCRTDDSSLTRAASEMSLVATGRISLKRDGFRLSEMLSTSMPCFACLRLFRMFMFWIGFWCKHESCR